MEVWLHEKKSKQGGLFQHTAMLWDKSESTLAGRVTWSIFSISIWTTRTEPAAPVRREMIESPGISVKNRERSSHRTAGQYQNRQLLLFTHYYPQATSNWPRKRKLEQKTGEKNHTERYSDLRLCFNETGSKCEGKCELTAQLIFPFLMATGSSAAVA